jgi:hypothetical protein
LIKLDTKVLINPPHFIIGPLFRSLDEMDEWFILFSNYLNVNYSTHSPSFLQIILVIHQPILYNLHYDHIIFSFENCYKLEDFHAMEHSMFYESNNLINTIDKQTIGLCRWSWQNINHLQNEENKFYGSCHTFIDSWKCKEKVYANHFNLNNG